MTREVGGTVGDGDFSPKSTRNAAGTTADHATSTAAVVSPSPSGRSSIRSDDQTDTERTHEPQALLNDTTVRDITTDTP